MHITSKLSETVYELYRDTDPRMRAEEYNTPS
jgi:hypothetical protein